MDIKDQKHAWETLRKLQEADRGRKGELERVITEDTSYYHGQHWGGRGKAWFSHTDGGIRRLPTDITPDPTRIRLVLNRIARNIQKVAVATFPQQIEVEVHPPPRDAGLTATQMAGLYEDMLNDAVDACGFVPVRRDVNFQRAIWASYGLGLRRRRRTRTLMVAGQEATLPDSDVEAFEFGPHQLTLDPANPSRDLRRHEFVVLTEVWSARRLRDWLGISVDEDKLKRIGDLALLEVACNTYSEGMLFGQYRSNSDSKGAVVHHMWIKGEDNRFGRMLIMVEGIDEKDDEKVLNWKDQESPFGGDRLPLVWYHAHRRAGDGPTGVSDVRMQKDDQDQLNIVKTVKARIALRSSGFQIAIDDNSLAPDERTDDKVRNKITNVVGGVLRWNSGSRNNPASPPQVLTFPGPPAFLNEDHGYHEESMREQVHRAEVNEGKTKTHVSPKTHMAAVEQSDQVLGSRVVEDIDEDERILTVLKGTVIMQVKEKNPTVLGRLRRLGLEDMELAMLFDADPFYTGCTVKVREASIRYRSPAQRRQELMETAAAQAIAPFDLRRALTQLDMPVTPDDRFYEKHFERAAQEVLRGADWEPQPFGEYTNFMLAAFRKALLDPIARQDPAARQRLIMAIDSQRMMLQAETATEGPAAQEAPPPATEQDLSDQSYEQVLASLGGAPPQAA